MTEPLLEVEGLDVTYPSRGGAVRAARDVSFALGRERLAIVGESGSGKSTTGRAILGLIPPPGVVRAQRLAFDGIDLGALSDAGWSRLRGRRLAMVMQDPEVRAQSRPARGRRRSCRPTACIGAPAAARPSDARSKCWNRCASATPKPSSASTRTSSPAAWASAS